MKKIYVNPNQAQAVEVFENGKVVVHFAGTAPDELHNGDFVQNAKVFTSSRHQPCDTAGIIEKMKQLRGDAINAAQH